jgi:hypothetical protein
MLAACCVQLRILQPRIRASREIAGDKSFMCGSYQKKEKLTGE